MSKSKIIFLFIFALFIIGLNIGSLLWVKSLKAEEITYIQNVKLWELAFDSQNRLWMIVSPKLGEYDTGDIELRVYENGVLTHTYTNIQLKGYRSFPQELIVDSTGHAWINWQEGVNVIDGEKPKVIPLDFRSKPGFISTIAVDAQGILWIGTYQYGLYIVDGNELKNYTMGNSGLLGNDVTGIAFDEQNRAWITAYDDGNTGGVNIFDGKEWQAYTPENSQLPSTEATSITIDKQNRVWIGTDKGLTVFDGKGWKSYSTDGVDLGSWVRSRYGRVVSMVFDGQERVWVNTTEVFDGKTWKTFYDPFFDPYQTGFGDIAVDNDGNVWLAYHPDNRVKIVRPGSPQPVSHTVAKMAFVVIKGGLIYITLILLIVWISVAFNTWGSIGYGLLGLPIFLYLLITSDIYYYYYYDFLFISATFGPIFGIIGGGVDIYFSRHGNINKKRWGLIGFVTGTVLSFCYLALPYFFTQ